MFAASNTYAQNSGGGWVAQPRPGASGSNASDFDWTGFTISGTNVNNNGTSNSGSFHCYSTFAGRGTLVGNIYNRSSTTTSSGASTYEWLWTPTGSNVGAPPPPLYVLAEGSSVADFSYSNTAKGLSGSGTLSYGSVISDYFSGTASAFQKTLYKVLLASGSPNVAVAINPVINHSYSGTPTGDFGVATEVLQTAGCPIVLSAPNPMNRPDLGDGTNQYVYDATTPDGLLRFPGAIRVAGAIAGDTAWLMRDPKAGLPHVGLTLDLPAETTSQGWFYLDQTLNSSIPADQIVVKYGSTNSPSDGFNYKGLPKLNGGFGNHLVTLTVDSKASQQAHIQTFFTGIDANNKSVANYPNAASNLAPDKSVIPNWYYYYNQVYGLTAAQGGYDKSGQTPSHIDLTSPYAVHIHDDAYGQYNVPVYSLSKPIKTGEFVSCLGNLSISGVHAYIFLCAHEAGHQSLSQQKDTNGLSIVYNWSPKDASGNFTQPYSQDGDDVIDAWEQTHHLNPGSSNTPSYNYGNTNDVPDDEVIADIQGLGGLFASVDAWSKDWANQGLQIGKPYFNPKPAANQEGFYFVFTPTDTNQTPFHVHSLSDLATHYPKNAILTDVSQMVGP